MNLLLTSVGRRGYLVDWFRAALDGRGVVHAASSDGFSPGLLDADVNTVLPRVADPRYAESLVAYVEANAIRAVIPLIDVDARAVASLSDALSRLGALPIVPDADVTRRLVDKWEAQAIYAAAGLVTARTYLGFESAAAAVESGTLSGRLVVKPRHGNGSIGVLFVDDAERLLGFRDAAEAAARSVPLGVDSVPDSAVSVVVQEHLEGEIFNCDVVNDLRGVHQGVLARERHALSHGETIAATSVNLRALDLLGERLAAVTNHRGPMDVDVVRTAAGEYIPIDCNPRFGGGYPFSHLAGADLPRAIVAWLRGEPVEPGWLRQDEGVTSAKTVGIRRV